MESGHFKEKQKNYNNKKTSQTYITTSIRIDKNRKFGDKPFSKSSKLHVQVWDRRYAP
jgi:hypothetical protein